MQHFSLLQHCIFPGFGHDWDSLFEETQAPDIKVGGVLCWELEPLFFNLFLFSSIFFRTFPYFPVVSRSYCLACVFIFFFMKHGIFMTCWGVN